LANLALCAVSRRFPAALSLTDHTFEEMFKNLNVDENFLFFTVDIQEWFVIRINKNSFSFSKSMVPIFNKYEEFRLPDSSEQFSI
jgi:hypothetical protein